MADVTLVLKADNTQYVKAVNDAQKATQKLNDTAEQGTKRRLGLIEQEQKRIESLTRQRNVATSEAIIKQRNQQIELANQQLDKYNNLGKDATKTTDTLTQSIGKWALSLGGAAAILKVLKDTLMKFTDVINTAKIVTAAYQQVLYNITTSQTNWTQGVLEAIKIQQEFNRLRVREYKERFLIQEKETQFQKLWYAALTDELSLKERIKKADEALAAKQEAVAIKRAHVQEEMNAHLKKILLQQGTEENVKAFWEARTTLESINAEFEQSTKRLYRMKQGLERQDHDQTIKRWHDEIDEQNKVYDARLAQQKIYQDLSRKLLDEYDKSNIESLTGGARLVAQRNFALKQIEQFKNEILAVGVLTLEQEQMIAVWTENVKKSFAEGFKKETPATVETKNIFSDFIGSLTPDILRKPKPAEKPMTILQLMGIDPDTEQGRNQLDALREAKDTILTTMDEIFEARVNDAQRRRELIETQINETQNDLNIELELYKAGYASNVAAKKKELEDLKKQREIALKKEEEAIKRKRQLDTAMQMSALITSSANIFKAYSEIPGGLLISLGVIAAMFAAFAASKVSARNAVKLAEGGSGSNTGIITGRSHAQGGERFLSHVEVERDEAWGVLSIPATQKFGKVFHHMVSSFNKGQIPAMPINKISSNVMVENTGPNSRLDQLITEQRKLNEKISSDSVQDIGNTRIIRKGSTTRIINK